jgi:tetratricopeptide (TPR) repeat protein
VELNPKHAPAYNNRGAVYARMGQYDRAVADYTRAAEIAPGYARAYVHRALAYYQLKDYDKAWDDVHIAQHLGQGFREKFLADLRQASGRDR